MSSYPFAARDDIVETVHGQAVADPYRWLEDPSSPETEAWSAAQDTRARAFLDACPGRAPLRQRLLELQAAGMVTAPVTRGPRLFFLRRAGDQQHAVLFVRESD